MALNGLFCAGVPLRNYSLTHTDILQREYSNVKPRLVSRCRSSAEWMNPFCSLSNTRNPSMKSSRTGFSRFLLIVDRMGKNISKLIRRSENSYIMNALSNDNKITALMRHKVLTTGSNTTKSVIGKHLNITGHKDCSQYGTTHTYICNIKHI